MVEIDYGEAGRIAVRALAPDAHDGIDLVSAPEGLNFADNYVSGALDEATKLGCEPPRVWRVEMTEAAGEAVGAKLLSSPARPAFACIQDSLAFGVFRAAAALGKVVGKDLTIIGGQNFPGSEHTAPPLSTFSTEDRHVAELLSQVMLRHVEGGGKRPIGGFERAVILPTALLRQSHSLIRHQP